MPKFKEIITEVNNTLKSVLNTERYQDGKWFNDVVVKTSNEDSVVLGIVSDSGEITSVEINDTYPIQVYHRIIPPQNYKAIPEDNYGDQGEVIEETATFNMVVCGDKARLKIADEDLAALMIANIPQKMSQSFVSNINLLSVLIDFDSCNSDNEDVYLKEFEKKYDLKPNTILFSVQWKVVSTFSKKCFGLC